MHVRKTIRMLLARFLLAGALLLVGAPSAPEEPASEKPASGEAAMPMRLVFQPESSLQVEGTSTIHDWTCAASEVIGFAQGETGNDGGALSSLSAARVTVPVAALDCDNGTMNRKMREALHSEQAPMIRYDVQEATLQTGSGDAVQVRATGQLAMAGATRTVTTQVKGEPLGAGRYRFTGAVPLDMTQFGMDPPTAMLGTLKTGKDVTVRFEIVAQPPQAN